ncbi:metallophosphoesterase family protein [Planctomyces sp. SH-PL62]|uniref:metallophosphoesterase family protein n=1 Tax=Planctomyces sp. SH-PL62 TaxID=1636152 RepID=UPI00078E9F1D|nr:metallophosphoesterase family protein [Planctomyces sp. SH-PL62]AMV36008.1 phosphodiesterase [Planctomyces sp. SH-PL62]
MRILVVSDLHANRAALAAIDEPHDVCFCLGDLVDYGPEPSACVRWAMTHADHAVRGNHDHGVAQGVPVTGDLGFRYLTRVTRPDMWEALAPDERKYLLQLPVTCRVTLDDVRYLLVHATPRDPLDEYLLRDEAGWARRLENVDADVVCVGHSHMQFKLKVGDKLVVNPGSVGISRDGDPRAAYAVIEDGRVELKRVPYPIEEVVAATQSTPWPDRAKAMLTHVFRNGRLPPPPSDPTHL